MLRPWDLQCLPPPGNRNSTEIDGRVGTLKKNINIRRVKKLVQKLQLQCLISLVIVTWTLSMHPNQVLARFWYANSARFERSWACWTGRPCHTVFYWYQPRRWVQKKLLWQQDPVFSPQKDTGNQKNQTWCTVRPRTSQSTLRSCWKTGSPTWRTH